MRLLYTVYRTPPPSTPASKLRDPPGSDRWVGPRRKKLPAGLTVVLAGSPGDPPATGSQSKTVREKTPDSPTVADGAKRWEILVESWRAQDNSISLTAPLRSRGTAPRSAQQPPKLPSSPDTHTKVSWFFFNLRQAQYKISVWSRMKPSNVNNYNSFELR